MSMFTKRRKDAARDNEINALKSELMLTKHHYGCMEAVNKVLAMKYEALKEQNALLTVQVQDLVRTLRRVHPYINDPTAYDHAGYAITTHPQQVKSEDARDA